ncbi:MAG: LacI family transcriptional regulator [Streptomycetaceae bacterium]|nr:MAG: LacI family transcriptional regulator [Streptomycetaceae bacterium]
MANDGKSTDFKQVRATIRDVARIAKVDPSLVSRIVNKDPKASASPATRKRVLDAVEELGYRANSAARMLKTARTQMIGLMLPDMANPMYAAIILGVEQRCKELGYGILLGDHAEGNSEKIFTDLLERGQVDGLLIASGTLSDTFLKKEILDQYKSVVMVNRRIKGVSSSVTVNDELGAALAVEHLAQFGTKTIAGIFGPSNIDTAQRRRKGFEGAISKLKLKQIVVEKNSWGMEAGRKAGIELLSKKTMPDAVFASTIMMGIGFLRAAHELGVAIPDQVRVVAMHDSDIANFLTPSLSTMHLPTVEMGSQSVDLLLRIIGGGSGSHLIVDTPPALIVRESSLRSGNK